MNSSWCGAFSAEERLLLACARVRFSRSDTELLTSLLRQPLDWDAVIAAAQWHRLLGLLFHHLRRFPPADGVPADALAALRTSYLLRSARHLRARGELARLLGLLRERGVPVVLLKGAALVGTVYREPGMRPMGDLDLLVPRARLEDAQRTVKEEGGYAAVETGDDDLHWSRHQHLPRLVGTKEPVAVEIHGHIVRLDSPLAFDIEEFWARARSLDLVELPAYTLSPEDLLLHLGLNFFRDRRFHSRGALGQLCDVAEVTRHQPSVDWQAVVDRARRYRIAAPTACSFRLAHALLGADVPEWVVPSLAPGMSDADVAAFARLRVVTMRKWVTTELVKPHEAYGHFNLARSIVRRIVPTRDYMRQHYGAAGVETYWRRLGHAAQALARIVQRPSELRDDLSVDRWMHSLYAVETADELS